MEPVGVVERGDAGRMNIAAMKELAREFKEQEEKQREGRAEDALGEMRRERNGEEDMVAPKLERGPEAVGVHGD